jgi:hypothetical protein
MWQTLAGLALDGRKGDKAGSDPSAVQHVLNTFAVLNVLQLLNIFGLVYLQRKKNARLANEENRQSDANTGETQPLLDEEPAHTRYSTDASMPVEERRDEASRKKEVKRGKVFMGTSVMLILFAWVLFMGTAWVRLGRNHDSS